MNETCRQYVCAIETKNIGEYPYPISEIGFPAKILSLSLIRLRIIFRRMDMFKSSFLYNPDNHNSYVRESTISNNQIFPLGARNLIPDCCVGVHHFTMTTFYQIVNLLIIKMWLCLFCRTHIYKVSKLKIMAVCDENFRYSLFFLLLSVWYSAFFSGNMKVAIHPWNSFHFWQNVGMGFPRIFLLPSPYQVRVWNMSFDRGK